MHSDPLPVHYSNIRDCLRQRMDVVADRDFYARDPEAHLQRLVEVSEKLNSLAVALPPGADPRLRHFLERSSYSKALEWLDLCLCSESRL